MRTIALGLASISMLLVTACGGDVTAQSPGTVSPETSPAATAAPDQSPTSNPRSVGGCGSDDPENVGTLTGVWRGDDDGFYYVRHIGDCVWWFGTSLEEIDPGEEAQPGFANVAVGRFTEERTIEVEWADIPLGDILGGGGLILRLSEDEDQLFVVGYEGDWGFGASMFGRWDPEGSNGAEASPGASP